MSEQEYLLAIVGPLVAHPELLTVERKTDERGVLLTLHVDQSDMGKVIGKGGETARAVRRLLRQFGMAREMRLSMRIYEPEGSRRSFGGEETDL